MAKANDLIVRLLLDSASFQGGVRGASKEVAKLREQVQNGSDVINGLTGGLVQSATKFATWGGAAAAAGKLIKDAYMSSETNADDFRRMQERVTGAYQFFVNTIERGQWSNFFENLGKAIQGAGELYDALDRLGSIKANNSAAIAILQSANARAKAELADKSISAERRKELQGQIKSNSDRLVALRSQEVNAGKDAATKKMMEAFSGDNLSEMLKEYAVKNIQQYGQAFFDKADAEIARLEKKQQRTSYTYTDTSGKLVTDSYNAGKLSAKEAQWLKFWWAVKKGETQLQEGLQLYADSINQSTQIYMERRKDLRQAGGGSAAAKGKGSGSTAKQVRDVAEVGSLNWISSMISDLQRQRGNTIDTAKQKEIDEKILELVQSRMDIWAKEKGVDIQKQGMQSGNPWSYVGRGSTAEDFSGISIDNDAISAGAKEVYALQEQWRKMQETAKDNAMSEAVMRLQDAFMSLGGAIEGTAGQMVQFAIQSASSIAQLVAQNAELMASAQAASLAGAAKNAFQLPFPYNLAMYASLAATIFGIFASLPKFATGGIVGGSLTSGDNNLVRVNSGEMILNSTQQARLFSLLDGSAAVGGGGSVTLRIKGDELVGVLNNYRRKKGAML